LRAHIRGHPGTRPWAWWRYEAREPRRRLGGKGVSLRDDWSYWGTPGSYVYEYDDDQWDPPVYETQAAYLERLGLLLPEERVSTSAKQGDGAQSRDNTRATSDVEDE
jgi:hypothetical protein